MIEDLVQQLIDRLDHQCLGKYRGYVYANEDPDKRGRIRAIVPRLLGERTPTGWAEPAAPYAGPDQGFFSVPDLGAGCWIEFEEGDLSKPIWTGCWWGAPTEEERALGDNSARRATPETAAAAEAAERTPETPQHNLPRESPEPKVRIFKSSTGHHIVLDDREGQERIEIHDSRGNRLILSQEGFDKIVLNDRTLNKGNRAAEVRGKDTLDVRASQTQDIGSDQTVRVGGDALHEYLGDFVERAGNGNYMRAFQGGSYSETLPNSTTVMQGGEERQVGGAGTLSYGGGLGVTSGGPVRFLSADPFNVTAGKADLSLNAISLSAGLGNVSINTRLGIMQLGGLTAISPMVLGDGLAIHHTMLSQILKAVNPPLAPFYGPALDVWAAMTPVLDLSYFGFVKRMPVG
ncbi:MAG: phage baseplate assembly protein V [Pseudomonadota bacterium]